MPWTAESITNELQEPFLASLFTLSSHHPYFVPEEHRGNLPDGPHPMAKSVAYADMSLRMFFDVAKKQPWYENTVFIICADHTRSEEHTSELQSRPHLVCRLLLEKKKKKIKTKIKQ